MGQSRICLLLAVLVIVFLSIPGCRTNRSTRDSGLHFAVSFTPEQNKEPIDGRVLLIVSTTAEPEPRFQITDENDTQQIFGIDVDGLRPGSAALIDGTVLGYPRKSLAEIQPGEYFVQAVLHRYETFRRADRHTVKLPMDKGEGQHWNQAPGNLYSTTQKLRIDPSSSGELKITLDRIIPQIPAPQDTKYVKHVSIQSDLLTRFWGRPMRIGAVVLLPEGFDSHPQARYPLMINHGHFPSTFDGFRETPPDPDLKPEYSKRFRLDGYNRIEQEYAYQFFKDWTGPEFPRFLIMEIQHANPYYDDSYAVNSANLGPYGDAINRELIPFVERKFRGIGQGWARFTYGGSTGGWEALATQVFYPDDYNGCFAACPDPIDFRAYTVVNIYEDKNAYYTEGTWKRTPRPGMRNYLGHVGTTLEQANQRELVLGTHSRSGEQWDIWEAVFGPAGDDGYPRRIWDKQTGEIDRKVAEYWKENYDIGYKLRRDWKTLGPKLKGKIHIYCGDMDNFFLNNAVYLVEEFLKGTQDPHYDGEVAYGDRAEHCWNGDPTRPNALSRLRYNQMYVPKIMERIRKTAPPGADLKSWLY